MQGINGKEHQALIESYKKFEELTDLVKYLINEEDERHTKEGIKEVRLLYLKFQTLLKELESCTKTYEFKKKSLQSILGKNIRKMNSELKRKKIDI